MEFDKQPILILTMRATVVPEVMMVRLLTVTGSTPATSGLKLPI